MPDANGNQYDANGNLITPNDPSHPDLVEQATNAMMGDGKTPGIVGWGRGYKVDPSASQQANGGFWQGMAKSGYQTAGQNVAPQLQGGPMDQTRGMQMTLAQQLQAQANGTGPSLAQGQLQHATDQNISQAYAMAQANPNDTGSARNLANQRAALSQQSAADAGQLRLQEQMQAQNQLGQVTAGMRGQDIGVSTENANLQGSQNQLNQQAQQYYMGAGMGQDQQQTADNMQMQQLNSANYLGQEGKNQQGFKDFMNMLSSASSAGSMMGGSDIRLKKDIRRHGVDVVPGVELCSWEYKALPGRRFMGVLAQELERVSPADVFFAEDGMRHVTERFHAQPSTLEG